jgi:hypothetical protein
MRVKFLLVSLVWAILVVCFSSIGGAAKDETLIFYTSFDNMSGDKIQDDSGNGSLGTLNGDAKIVKDGKYGSAVSLGGAGHVDCGNNKILNQAFPGLTIEAWVNPKVLGEQAIAVKWAWTVAGDHIGLFLFSGKGLIAVADGLTSEGGFQGTKAIKTNEWAHVAATWNSKDFSYQIYINGELDGSGKQNGKGVSTKSPETLKIGAQITGTQRYFTGLVDEVAIYSRVLTEEEIKKDMKGNIADVQPSGKLSATWAIIKTQY